MAEKGGIMKRTASLLLTAVVFLTGGMTLYEDQSQTPLLLPKYGTIISNEIEFTLSEKGGVVIVNYLGTASSPNTQTLACYPIASLVVDGDSIEFSEHPIYAPFGYVNSAQGSSFMLALQPGSHNIQLKVYGAEYDTGYDTLELESPPLLQVLVLEPDTSSGSLVTEQPEVDDRQTSTSTVSYGSSITVPGCTEVVDISGRKVDCEIIDDRILTGSLCPGTYFAISDQGKKVKIVKID